MWLRNMSINIRLLIIISLFVIYSCEKDNQGPIYSTECAECIEHQYQQIYNDNLIDLILIPGTYCLGDSAWNMPNSLNYWTQIDQDLLNLMTESGYCNFLEIQDTIN